MVRGLRPGVSASGPRRAAERGWGREGRAADGQGSGRALLESAWGSSCGTASSSVLDRGLG